MSTNTPNTPGKPKITLSSAQVPSFYVEGISKMMLGFPNCRISFNSFAEQRPDGSEAHQLACELVVPTASLLEIIAAITNNMAANKEMINNFGAEWIAKVNELVNATTPIQLPGQDIEKAPD